MINKLQQDHFKVTANSHEENVQYMAGRGAQINTKNRYFKDEKTKEHVEGIDEWTETNIATQYIEQESKTIVNKVDSPDVGMFYSMNPMQAVNMVVFIALPVMCMNIGVIVPGLILKEK